MNIAVLSGEVMNDPSFAGNGRKVAKFILLVPYCRGENKMKHTTVPCVVFNLSDELIKALRKGVRVIFRGRLHTSVWEVSGTGNDNGSKKRYQTEVIVYPDSFKILDYHDVYSKRRDSIKEKSGA